MPEVEYIEIVIFETEYDNSVGNIDDYDSSSIRVLNQSRAWYLSNGTRYPEPAQTNEEGLHNASLLPLEHTQSDRILNQLMFVPPNYNATHQMGQFKTILVPNMPHWWDIKEDDTIFADCPVKKCRITKINDESSVADLVFFHESYILLPNKRQPEQIYALYHLESPYHTESMIHTGKVDIFRLFV